MSATRLRLLAIPPETASFSSLGFDFIHTLRNRDEILRSDVIWTHTEHEYLSVALLLLLKGRKASPALLAQSVWLLDKWPESRRLVAQWEANTAYGRLCEARDVSHFVAYLLSEPVKLFTGSVLVIDGGISSQGW